MNMNIINPRQIKKLHCIKPLEFNIEIIKTGNYY